MLSQECEWSFLPSSWRDSLLTNPTRPQPRKSWSESHFNKCKNQASRCQNNLATIRAIASRKNPCFLKIQLLSTTYQYNYQNCWIFKYYFEEVFVIIIIIILPTYITLWYFYDNFQSHSWFLSHFLMGQHIYIYIQYNNRKGFIPCHYNQSSPSKIQFGIVLLF